MHRQMFETDVPKYAHPLSRRECFGCLSFELPVHNSQHSMLTANLHEKESNLPLALHPRSPFPCSCTSSAISYPLHGHFASNLPVRDFVLLSTLLHPMLCSRPSIPTQLDEICGLKGWQSPVSDVSGILAGWSCSGMLEPGLFEAERIQT